MIRIGEFSKIAQVAGSQLRYYDEIGLLNPIKIDEWTGYRYYSVDQLPQINRILALKELGLSLDQIKRMVHDDVPAEEIRGMLTLKKAQVEQSIRAELLRLQQIEARLRQIEEHGQFEKFDIILKSVPAQPFLAQRKTYPSFEAASTQIGIIHQSLPDKIAKKKVGPFTAILHSEIYEFEGMDVEMGFPLLEEIELSVPLPDQQALAIRQLPAVDSMVSVLQNGSPATAHRCRAAVAAWVAANGYRFDGNSREIFIVPPLPGKEDETVIEIQYPVKKDEPYSLIQA